MIDDVLCPTDGSRRAERAAVEGLRVAREYDADVHLLHVIDTSLIDLRTLKPAEREAVHEASEAAMSRVAAVAEELGVMTDRTVMQGRPHRAILQYVDDHGIDLVALGRRGLTSLESMLLGSVSSRVVAGAPVPVLTAGGEAELTVETVTDGRYERILVATDGSDGASRAAEHALGFAERFGAEVDILYVIDERAYLPYPRGDEIEQYVTDLLRDRGERATGRIADRARSAGVPVTETVEIGVPSRVIATVAGDRDADLIALGTAGSGGIGRNLVGSVADRVIRLATVPVLTARDDG